MDYLIDTGYKNRGEKMNKRIGIQKTCIAVAVFMFFSFLMIDNSFAQSSEDLLFAEIPIVTSAIGREQKYNEVASSMTVITKQDIRRSGARNIPDLFYRVPGMEVRKIDGHRYYVSIRSTGSLFQGNTLVLLDNVIVFNSLSGGTNWELLPVTLNEIERIEIIRGPGGVLYSSNAVNGVINIISKKSTDKNNYVAMRAGTQGLFLQELGMGEKVNDKLSMRVYAQHNEDAGLVHMKGDSNLKDPTNSAITGIKVQYDWSKDTNFVLDGKYLNENAINDGPNVNGASIKRPGFQGILSTQFQQKVNDVYDYNIHLDFMGMSPTDTASYDSRSSSYTFNTQHNLKYNFLGNHGTSFGLEVRWIKISKLPGFEPPADPWQTQKVDSFFFQDEYRPTKKLILTAGARITSNTNLRPQTDILFEPKVSAVYLLNDLNSLRAVISRAMKTPSMTDRDLSYTVYPNHVLRGSQDLDPEKNTTYELGWQGLMLNKKLNIYASVFYSDLKDPIFLSSIYTLNGVTFYEPIINNGSVYSTGIELDAKYKLTDDLAVKSDYTYINAAPRPNFDNDGGYERNQSLGMSKHQFGLGLSYTKNPLTLDIYVKWISKYIDTQDSQIAGQILKFPSYWKPSLRVAYAFKMPGMKMKERDAEVELVANDLFGANTVESPHRYIREPDIFAGLKVKF
jgi:iron complex outermembrane receptor protein